MFYHCLHMLPARVLKDCGIVRAPSELRVSRERNVLTVAFPGEEPVGLSAEMLRVLSPSAEVQGHSPEQRSWSRARKTSPSRTSSRSAITLSASSSATATRPASTPGPIWRNWPASAMSFGPNICGSSRKRDWLARVDRCHEIVTGERRKARGRLLFIHLRLVVNVRWISLTCMPAGVLRGQVGDTQGRNR